MDVRYEMVECLYSFNLAKNVCSIGAVIPWRVYELLLRSIA